MLHSDTRCYGCYTVFHGVKTVLQGVTRFNRVLHGLTGCYTVLHGVTRCFMVSHGVSWCYTVFHGVTRCFMVSHGVSWCYTVLEGVTRCYIVQRFHPLSIALGQADHSLFVWLFLS